MLVDVEVYVPAVLLNCTRLLSDDLKPNCRDGRLMTIALAKSGRRPRPRPVHTTLMSCNHSEAGMQGDGAVKMKANRLDRHETVSMGMGDGIGEGPFYTEPAAKVISRQISLACKQMPYTEKEQRPKTRSERRTPSPHWR